MRPQKEIKNMFLETGGRGSLLYSDRKLSKIGSCRFVGNSTFWIYTKEISKQSNEGAAGFYFQFTVKCERKGIH